jgi:prepilin-type N-terminal cleavage/methylation domain-containing protein
MSHPLARPLVRELRNESQRAFTLIELLAVIGIIAILSAITFGIVKGVNERAAIGQAKAELASLAQSLEEYKRQYGDYPRVGTSATPETTASTGGQSGKFFNSLFGKLGPAGAPIDAKVFIEATKFSLSVATLPTGGNTTPVANAFLDPWGRFYVYAYASGWSTYQLLSAGPDGKILDAFDPSTGVVTPSTTDLDNIYANRN